MLNGVRRILGSVRRVMGRSRYHPTAVAIDTQSSARILSASRSTRVLASAEDDAVRQIGSDDEALFEALFLMLLLLLSSDAIVLLEGLLVPLMDETSSSDVFRALYDDLGDGDFRKLVIL